MTLKPASASAAIWWRHEYASSGKPCSSSTAGPSPARCTASSMPLAVMISGGGNGAVAGTGDPRRVSGRRPQRPAVALEEHGLLDGHAAQARRQAAGGAAEADEP